MASEEPLLHAPGALATVSPALVAAPSTVLRLLSAPKLSH